MERRKIPPVLTKLSAGIVVGTAIYETTAITLNTLCGTDLPYFPWQLTPHNAAAAAIVYGTTTVGCSVVSIT